MAKRGARITAYERGHILHEMLDAQDIQSFNLGMFLVSVEAGETPPWRTPEEAVMSEGIPVPPRNEIMEYARRMYQAERPRAKGKRVRSNPVLRGGKPLPVHMRPWGWEITASGFPEEPGLKRIGKFFVYNLYLGSADLSKEQRKNLFQRVKSLLKKRKGWAFYTRDDDGNLMYRGKLYLPEGMSHPREGTEEILFAPLDWAMADVGATSIHYGWDKWRVL